MSHNSVTNSCTFCNVAPHCMSAFLPNLGLELGDFIVTSESEIRPRKGAAHFLDDPDTQIRNLDTRFGPLGYIDRKYAYRLSVKDDKKKHKNEDTPDAATMRITFSMSGAGPLVVCEPPCFIDSCSKHRKMPMASFITLELDGQLLDTSHVPHAVEVGGPFCKVVSGSVAAGDHILRISTSVVNPDYVMISHIIPFS